MKGILLILFAACIDGIQILVGLAFAALQFATPAGGGIAGALAAGTYCWNTSTGILSGIVNSVACTAAGGVVGAGVSAFAIPIGAAVDVTISILFGGLLIFILAAEGMFYPGMTIAAFAGEALPFVDIFPGWTLLAWRATRTKNAANKGSSKGASMLFGLSLIPGVTQKIGALVPRTARPIPHAEEFQPAQPQPAVRQTPHLPALITKNFGDIRPANDNTRYTHANAA